MRLICVNCLIVVVALNVLSSPSHKSQNIEGKKTLIQAWEKARAPSDSAVLPPRSILQGVALASPDSTESQVEDTEDPLELQRLYDAWLAKEFF